MRGTASRVLGRRDVQVFLLLWAPVVWLWFLAADSSRRYPETKEYFLDPLVLFLAQVLGPGLLLLGAAAGVERYHSIRRSGGASRCWKDVAYLLVSFFGCSLTIAVGFCAVILGLGLLETWFWIFFLEPPLSSLFEKFGWYVSSWQPRFWIATSCLGWILGFWFGRRWGRFIPALLAAGTISTLGGLTIRAGSHIRVGGESDFPFEVSAEELLSGALVVDALLLLTVLLVVAFFIDVLVGSRRGAVWRIGCCSVLLALWLPLFLWYRAFLLQKVDPWPPPAASIEGLDPVTNRLWAKFGPVWLNHYLFALDCPSLPSSAHFKGPQVLHAVPAVRLARHEVRYDPYAPAILVVPAEFRMPLSSQRVCRSPRGVETLDLGDGDWFWQTFPVRSPGPNWYAWADRDYKVVFGEDETGQRHRRLQSRLFLYCPKTGEQRIVITRPAASRQHIGQRPWFRDNGYTIWPETELQGGDPPEAVPVEPGGDKKTGDIRFLLADRFLSLPDSHVDRPVRAFSNTLYERRISAIITFEMCKPWSDGQIIKIPSPVGNHGCIWTAHRASMLRVYENGVLIRSLDDANTQLDPLWSPDGNYLVYVTWYANGTPGVKLGYPMPRTVFDPKTEGFPILLWDTNSNWLAVGMDLSIESPRIAVVSFPDLQSRSIKVSPSREDYKSIQVLHDGSLAYIDDGKVFQWRPEWDKPVCIYDPGRETVKKSALPG